MLSLAFVCMFVLLLAGLHKKLRTYLCDFFVLISFMGEDGVI